MTIQEGEKIPSIDLQYKDSEGVQTINSDDLFGGRKAVLFALPGAFTPTCSAKHLPGYVELASGFFSNGVDRIICLSVNDAHVMDAWGRDQNVGDSVMMIADGEGNFTRAIGMEVDIPGMGVRSKRYAMIVNDGLVEALNLEQPREFKVSDAQTMLAAL